MVDVLTLCVIIAGIASLAGVWVYYFLQINTPGSTTTTPSYRRVPASQEEMRQQVEEIPPSSGKHLYTLFWLHGLGDVPSSWLAGMRSLRLQHTKIILPSAPTINVSLNAGK